MLISAKQFKRQVTIVASIIAFGCFNRGQITAEQAGRIAVEKYKNLGSTWPEIHVRSATLTNQTWTVVLESIPPMPGGHGIVKISEFGKIVSILGGK
jgi:hypothetical protein